MATEYTTNKLGTAEDNDLYSYFILNNKVYKRVSSTFSGLNTGGKITEVVLNDSTWTALPATALDGRNAMSIINRSGSDIKINYDNTIATYTGVLILTDTERFYDIGDNIIIYGKSESGTMPTIVVEELS